MAEQEPPTESVPGLADESGPPGGDHGERPTVPMRRRWTASAAVPRPVRRRRLFRLRPPTETETGDDTVREHTLDMPAEELAAMLREPAPRQQRVPPPAWPHPPLPPPAPPPGRPPYSGRPPLSGTPPPPWTPPPGWQPPRGWVPPGWVRIRRRRWPWVLLTVGALAVACCCGVPTLIAKPFLDEYPAQVSTPARAGGLVRVDDAAARRLAADLKRRVRSEYMLTDDVFAAVYTEPETDGENVTVLGAARLVLDPDKDLKSALGRLSRLTVTGSRALDAGRLGGRLRCGQVDGARGTVVCGWADHGSIGVAVFRGWSTEESADLLRGLRAAVVTRS